MLRKILKPFVGILMLLAMTTTVILGNESTPSNWAITEVNEAIGHGLIHESLMEGYRQPIKRYEYVLLALSIVEKTGRDIILESEYAFSDILGHPYEREILKAYSFKIIDGYGNGLFKPDANITRQEVASLVYKLMKVLALDDDTLIQADTQYSDGIHISSWAKKAVDYCYQNDIMKGVGKDQIGLDIIRPLGTTTLEEAILLMYRLANQEQIINAPSIGQITIDENNTDSTVLKEAGDLFDLTLFSRQFSEETATVLLGLEDSEEVRIVDVSDRSALLSIGGNSTIYMVRDSRGIILELNSQTNIDASLETLYKELLKAMNGNDFVLGRIEDGIKGLRNNGIRFEESIGETYQIMGYFDDTVDDVYIVKFHDVAR
ncbi:S-layer homology domain-containing protein [Petrocella sp. FN5]|uniref:S-layer homology domain-containing protein n=1 Tax=Petrocella sp. FN5 TaxID=3032002 RepID=UPI0023DAA824|nr:S-layer homology domain-containing protein [Petrocella sp. FN5]MDF1616285.1 S-layer homology domain-containing protein [Petrocella sp. FN5]